MNENFDLLSDGSNDSFFEEPLPLMRKQSINKEKKSFLGDSKDNLFGKRETLENIGREGSDKNISFLNKSAKLIDTDDILNTLGFDKKNASSEKTDLKKSVNKSNLIETIFGPPKQETEVYSDVSKETASKNLPFSVGDSRRPRSQHTGTNLQDPLGLFSNKPSLSQSADTLLKTSDKVIESTDNEARSKITGSPVLSLSTSKILETKNNPNVKNIPGWLDKGAVKPLKSDSEILKTSKQDEHGIKKFTEVSIPQKTSKGISDVVDTEDNTPKVSKEIKLAESEMEYQKTLSTLQHQESQLLMTIQLKKYEENLADLQKKQQDVFSKQEKQFNTFIEQQSLKQQIMENNIKLQHERIMNNIQMSLSGHSFVASENINSTDMVNKNKNEDCRLLEELIETLKQRQNEEIFLLNESYKKQISLLENSMEAIESRLKSELTTLSEHFQETVSALKNEHLDEIDNYKRKLAELTTAHAQEIKLNRENHNQIVDDIKNEYLKVLENFKKAKQMEVSILDNASSYMQKLDNSLNVLENNTITLSNVQNKIQNDYDILSSTKEQSLNVKEEEIKLTKKALEKSREASEMERMQVIGLVKSLEFKLMEQTQTSKEESWALQQAIGVLAARSAAFDREVEFTRSTLEREKQQLKTAKESMLEEQEKVMLQIMEEKLLISTERARLETAAKLHKNFNSNKSEMEIDAAIKVANEAAELCNREREVLYRKQNELDSIRRSLLDKEENLKLKQLELQEMYKNAEIKARDNEKVLSEAKLLETKYNTRLRDIQGQLVSLTNREKKLVEEKIALSKERLALHTNVKRIKKCSLCAVENVETGVESENHFVEQDFPSQLFHHVSDPDIMRLRYEIDEDHIS